MEETELPALPESSPLDAPRLSIGHLLLWMACSAALLSFYRWVNTSGAIHLSTIQWAIRSLVLGPALAGLFVCVARWWRGMRFPTQPGEWLLVLTGVSAMMFVASQVLFAIALSLGYWEDDIRIFLIVGVGFFCMATIDLLVGVLARMPFRWRGVFFAVALGMLSNCLMFFVDALIVHDESYLDFLIPWSSVFQVVLWLDNAVCLLSIAICLVIDGVKRISWGWLHWTGVIVFAADSLNELIVALR